MFAGISGGSMVAAGLVCGRSPTFIRRLLDILAPRVFNPKVRTPPLYPHLHLRPRPDQPLFRRQGRFRTGKAIQSSKFANKNLLVAGSESAFDRPNQPTNQPTTPITIFGIYAFLISSSSPVTKNIKLDQLRPKMLLIPSFLLDNGLNNEERSWEPLIFHNVVRELSIHLEPIMSYSRLTRCHVTHLPPP